jgi:hypothetical protein
VKFCLKVGDKDLSENFSAQMEFCKIDPWPQSPARGRVRGLLQDALAAVGDAAVRQQADDRKEATESGPDLVAVGLDDAREP